MNSRTHSSRSPDSAVEEHIDGESSQLLIELLCQSPDDGAGVEAVTFRVRHHKQLALLDQLDAAKPLILMAYEGRSAGPQKTGTTAP